MSRVYLNGEYLPLDEANINVLDRGFTFGDGVYEVIPVFNRTVFRQQQHIQRLRNSLEAIYMKDPLTSQEWADIFSTLIESVGTLDQSIYLQITRGISERDHDISLADAPTVFVMSRELQKKNYEQGISAITHEDIRWSYCDIKAITLLPSVILRHRARQMDAREAILIRDDHVTEGAASNVFVIKDDTVYTTPKDNQVLPGVTRDLVLELLEDGGINYQETSIARALLFAADEIWITSSTWEIVPVTRIDDEPVGEGVPGAMWNRTMQLYQQYKRAHSQ